MGLFFPASCGKQESRRQAEKAAEEAAASLQGTESPLELHPKAPKSATGSQRSACGRRFDESQCAASFHECSGRENLPRALSVPSTL